MATMLADPYELMELAALVIDPGFLSTVTSCARPDTVLSIWLDQALDFEKHGRVAQLLQARDVGGHQLAAVNVRRLVTLDLF